jgi:hypothetical protein
MTHISGFERSQLLLLPEAIDDYVVGDNPVRFIDAFVDGLDLAAAGFKRVTPKVTGRPGYAPGDVATSRSRTSIEVWLQGSQQPDDLDVAVAFGLKPTA